MPGSSNLEIDSAFSKHCHLEVLLKEGLLVFHLLEFLIRNILTAEKLQVLLKTLVAVTMDHLKIKLAEQPPLFQG